MTEPLRRTYAFNAIHVVQFLRPSDDDTGSRLFTRVIKPRANAGGLPAVYWEASTSEELIAILKAIEEDTRANSRKPILHIECHGSASGIGHDGDIVPWQELKPLLVSINLASRMGLLVVVAGCHGLHLLQTLLPTDRSPVWGFIGPDEQVLPTDIAHGFGAFYAELLSTLDFNRALDSLRAADRSNPDTWKVQNAEFFFAFTFGEYLRLKASPEALRQREDDIVATLTLARRLPVEAMLRFRSQVRRQLREHPGDFHRYKQTFLMMDLFPENAPQFPITYSEALVLHERVRALTPPDAA